MSFRIPGVARLKCTKKIREEHSEPQSLRSLQLRIPLEALDIEFREFGVHDEEFANAVSRPETRLERRQLNRLGILRQMGRVLTDLARQVDERNHHADGGHDFAEVSQVVERHGCIPPALRQREQWQ